MKRLYIILSFFMAFNVAYAQHTQTIRGKVVDQLSQMELPGATVIVLNTEPVLGVTSDAKGNFRLENVPVGRQSVRVSYIGYQDFTASNLILTSAKEVILTINLEELLIQVEEVEIKSKKETAAVNNEVIAVSGRGFDMEETNRYAGSREDPSRMVANYAGVSGANDSRNDIIVRGNSPLGVLWRLDGIDIPNPNHFSVAGATGGPVSMLNNNLLDQSDFITGAFPAEYGNKMASVFDLQMRKGNDEQFEFTSQFGMNGIELLSEGPISKKNKSSYLASYRYSTLQLFTMLGIDFGAPGLPQYQDLSLKFNFPTKNFGTFSMMGIGGKSTITILDEERLEADLITDLNRGYDLITGSQMGVVGISNKYLFGKKTYGKLTIAVSGTGFYTLIDSIMVDSNKVRTKMDSLYINTSDETKADIIYKLHHKFNQRHFVKIGVNQSRLFYRMNEKNIRWVFYDNDGETNMLQSFFHWQWKLSMKLTANTGVNYKYFGLNDKTAIEPRFGLKYDPLPGTSVNFGFGVHNQSQILGVYLTESKQTDAFGRPIPGAPVTMTNRSLDYSKAIHYVVSFSQSLGINWKFKSEFYLQDISQVPVEHKPSSFSMLNAGADYNGPPRMDSLVNKGVGENRGVELTLERLFSNGYYMMTNVSLFESVFRGSDNVLRSTLFDGGYVVNFLGGAEFEVGNKGKVLVLDGKCTWAGGKRYTPIYADSSVIMNYAVYNQDSAYALQFKPYIKVDLKIGFRQNYSKVSITWYFSVENIFNRENVLQQIYNNSTHKVEEVYQLKIFPIGGFRMEF